MFNQIDLNSRYICQCSCRWNDPVLEKWEWKAPWTTYSLPKVVSGREPKEWAKNSFTYFRYHIFTSINLHFSIAQHGKMKGNVCTGSPLGILCGYHFTYRSKFPLEYTRFVLLWFSPTWSRYICTQITEEWIMFLELLPDFFNELTCTTLMNHVSYA